MRLSILLIFISIALFSCKTITLNDEQIIANIPDDIELIKIPAGAFSSGEDAIEKYITYDYMMMKFPVTNSQYIDYLIEAKSLGMIIIDSLGVFGQYSGDAFWPPGSYQFIDFNNNNSRNGYHSPDYFFTIWRYVENIQESYSNHPVTHISWFGANAFARFYGMRLPTSEEWEKAARANSEYDYSWGNTLQPNYANFKDSGDIYDNDTTPVGYFNGYGNTNDSYSPYGIYDMSGNVWEWTSSWWRDTSGKIIKGGSWNSKLSNDDIKDMFVWFELGVGYSATNISNEIGFRCVKDM